MERQRDRRRQKETKRNETKRHEQRPGQTDQERETDRLKKIHIEKYRQTDIAKDRHSEGWTGPGRGRKRQKEIHRDKKTHRDGRGETHR